MTPEESEAMQTAYDGWVDYWLAKNGEPELKPLPEYAGHGSQGEGQYCQYSLLVDANEEQQADLDKRIADALAKVRGTSDGA